MFSSISKLSTANCYFSVRNFSTTRNLAKNHYKLVIVGGGAAGAASSHIYGRKWGSKNVAVIEHQKFHWYQPGWTLVGGGMKTLEQTRRPMGDILSNKTTWIQDKVALFQPNRNSLTTQNGTEIGYDFLIVATGIQTRFDLIKGAIEAFGTPGVCSNYDANYVQLTYETIKKFKGGNAIFTFPTGVIKCPGAPQKIAYVADAHFRQAGIRDKTNISYNTALGVIFGSPRYAVELIKVAKNRNISVNFRHNLVEVKSDRKEAIFDVFDTDGKLVEKKTFPYDMLHISPPCKTPIELSSNAELVDSAGFLAVDKETLQHKKFPNIFGLGDCTNVPTARTAAAIASQLGIVRKNLTSVMEGKTVQSKYDGYTSCPLLTSTNRLILAEFSGFTGLPIETFPVDQRKERYSGYLFKRHFLPFLYWKIFTRGKLTEFASKIVVNPELVAKMMQSRLR